MQASLQIYMSGLTEGSRMAVSAAMLYREGLGEFRHAIIYDEVHLAQDLDPNVGIEAWALATLMEHTDRIKAALATQIERGQRTLINEVELIKKDLRVGAWPVPPSPAMIDPGQPIPAAARGLSFGFSPRCCE